MKVAIYTLGCKVNQYETQAMEQELLARGHTLTEFSDEADAYIVNTCSVTAVSDQKSRQVIHGVQRKHPGAVVAVCGCYPQTHADDVRTLGVDLISGTGDRTGFIRLLEEAAAEKRQIEAIDQPFERRVFEVLPAGGLGGRTRAMLKVEDGCVNFCTYCIIPYARGRVRSLPVPTAVEQTRALAAEGYREIVVTGIEISSWGQDLKNGSSLIDLVDGVCRTVPDLRIRLGSLEPRTITEEFCRRAAVLPNLCPHFHLSLQSGCDATLKRMNRKYDTARYYESIKLLREVFQHPAITTDLIVGFPQETEDEFAQTLAFLRRCAFSSMHIFPYSRRPGTPAAAMEGQIPRHVQEDRARRAAAVAAELEQDYLSALVGATLPVLFEEEKDGLWQGHAPNYVPVRVQGEDLHNQLRPVEITGIKGSTLVGRLL